MAMNMVSRKSMIVLILITSLLPDLLSSEHNPEPQFNEGDSIPLFANKLVPRANNCKAYSYYELPFCPPGDPILNRKKSLEEIVSGDCFTRTKYELKFKIGAVWQILCKKTLTKDEVKRFRQAVGNGSEYHMYYNNILLRGKVGFVNFGRGTAVSSRPRYYLVKHIDFFSKYYENQVVNIESISDLYSAIDITEDAEIRVRFSYSVFWKDSVIEPTKSVSQNGTASMKQWWSSEDKGLHDSRWIFFVLNLFLWLRLLCRCCRSRSRPEFRSWRLLSTILGLGIQLLIMACLSFIWVHDFRDFQYYPCKLGPMTTLVLTCCLICSCYGFYNDSSPSGFKCTHDIRSLIKYIFNYVLLLIIVVVVNEVAKLAFATANFWTTAIIFIVYRILSLYFPKNRDSLYTLEFVSWRPVIPWWQSMSITTPVQMFIGGLLPFIAISRKMDEIYAIFLLLKLCGVYSTMLSSFFVVILVTILMGAGFTTYQLYCRDFNWGWRSVLRGGSTAIFMFAYGVYFYCRVNEEISFLNLYSFLVYNACLCCILFMVLAAVSFYASLLAYYSYEHLVLLQEPSMIGLFLVRYSENY